MRDRLIELLGDFPIFHSTMKERWMPEAVERLADHLLAEGVIVLPCKVGDTVYVKAIQADAIKKMQERLKAKVNGDIDRCYALGFSVAGPLSLFLDEIDEIAKEMLENAE